jgi:hypothetical protein
VVDHLRELRKDTFVHFKELLRCCLVQVEHLESRELKTLIKNRVKDLTEQLGVEDVGFNHRTGAVVEKSGRTVDPKIHLTFMSISLFGLTAVDRVSHAVFSEHSPDGSWSLVFGCQTVVGTANVGQLFDRVFSNQLKADGDIFRKILNRVLDKGV